MKRSVNEIQTMVLKAARGAGVPLGHAEDLAAAIPYLTSSPDLVRAFQDVLDCLNQPANAITQSGPNIFGPGNPVMVLPAAIDAVLAGDGPVRIELPDTALTCAMVSAADTRLTLSASNQLSLGASNRSNPSWQPVAVPDDIWQALNVFAMRTYVPETEASRLKGAGAGLTDND